MNYNRLKKKHNPARNQCAKSKWTDIRLQAIQPSLREGLQAVMINSKTHGAFTN